MKTLHFTAAVIMGFSVVAAPARAAGMQGQPVNSPSAPANQFAGSAPVVNGTPVFIPTAAAATGGNPNHGDSRHDGHDLDHDRGTMRGFHDWNGIFVGGFWYPSWNSYGIASAPVDVVPGNGDGNTYNVPWNVPPPHSVTDQPSNNATATLGPGFHQLGVQWAQDLRRNVVTWDQFIDYMKASVLTALPSDEVDFRKGFISAYGSNAEAAFNKAAEQAGEVIPKGPKIIYMGPEN